MGSKTKAVPADTRTVELPDWVNRGGRETYDFAKDIAGNYQDWVYQGPRVADLSATERQGIGAVQDNVGAWDPYFQSAHQQAGRIGSTIDAGTGGTVTVGADGARHYSYDPFSRESLERYTNPYNELVTQRAADDFRRQRAIDQKGIHQDAASAGAWGGSRHAIAESLHDERTSDTLGDIFAEGRQRSFDDAARRWESDREALFRQAGFDTDNAARAAAAYGGLADQRQRLGMGDADALLRAGGLERAIEQAKLDAEGARHREMAQAAMDAANLRTSVLGGVPYERTTTGTRYIEQPNMWGQILGGGLAAAGQIWSDPGVKKNVRPFSDEEALEALTGTPVYGYRYKDEAVALGQPANDRVGPMADDWAANLGGNGREIDVAQAIGALTGAVRALDKRTRGASEHMRMAA